MNLVMIRSIDTTNDNTNPHFQRYVEEHYVESRKVEVVVLVRSSIPQTTIYQSSLSANVEERYVESRKVVVDFIPSWSYDVTKLQCDIIELLVTSW